MSPALAGRFSTTAPPGKPQVKYFKRTGGVERAALPQVEKLRRQTKGRSELHGNREIPHPKVSCVIKGRKDQTNVNRPREANVPFSREAKTHTSPAWPWKCRR